MNPSTYKLICDRVIYPTFEHYQKWYGGIILPERDLDEVFAYYEDLVGYAKRHYMLNQSGLLNRHKVSAALMIAILKAKPIKKTEPKYYEPNTKDGPAAWSFNEKLAITVALSVLRSFIAARVDCAFSGELVSKAVFEDVCKEDLEIFANGIPINRRELEDWERELYEIRQDGAYNVLSFAHILSNLEKSARLEYFLKHKDKTPTYPNPELLSDNPAEVLTVDQVFGYDS